MVGLVVGLLLVFGSAANVVAGDAYDESGVLRQELSDTVMNQGSLKDAPSTTPPKPDAWGISSFSSYNIAPADCRPRLDTEVNFSSGDYYIFHTGGSSMFCDAAFHVPTGALVTGVTYWYYDDDSDEDFWYWIYDTLADTPNPSSVQIQNYQSSGTPGYYGVYDDFDTPITAYNYEVAAGGAHFYQVLIRLGSGTASSAVRFGGMNVWYMRQISPDPAYATFSDVPVGAFGHRQIEALVASGITSGCGGGNFCPGAPLTRSQMAVFLAKALGLHWPDA
jgi:hypothetical protein